MIPARFEIVNCDGIVVAYAETEERARELIRFDHGNDPVKRYNTYTIRRKY